jgi:predicted alpha/beta hydrolase family esterase
MHFVIVPGIDGSGQDHWQSLWQDEWGSSATRIGPSSWTEPDLTDWCHALDQATEGYRAAGVVLVAHSLGCVAADYWLSRAQPGVRGAFLVAPPDVAGPNFPAAAAPSFTTIEAAPLTVPGLVVSSDDDPYCTPQVARRLAAAWGAGHVSVGAVGHINTASGVGTWEPGRALLTAFAAGLGSPFPPATPAS